MNKFILKFVLAILMMPLLGSSVLAEGQNAPKVFVQFLPGKGERAVIPLTTELRLTQSLPAGKYRVKAKVALTTEKTLEVVDSRALKWREPVRPLEGVSGWLKRDGAWIWTPRANSVPLVFPFEAVQGDGDREPDLAVFDELWLDFDESAPGNSCRISVAMNAVAKDAKINEKESGIQKLRLVSEATETLSPVLSIDTASANWKPKDNIYLAKRVLGLSFDEDWRYIQDRKNTVIQRRFHQDLRDVEVLDLLFTPGVAVERVNIWVSRKDHLRSDELIDWDAMPKQIEPTPEGTHVRLHLGDAVRTRLATRKREDPAFLAEVAIFISGETERMARQKPLRKLVFRSMSTTRLMRESDDAVRLLQRSELVFPGHRRLAIDLRPLAKRGWREANLEKGAKTLSPSDPTQYCGIGPTSLRLVTLGEGRRPVSVGDASRFDQSLGGPFLKPPSVGDVVEWIETDSYLPFALLPVQPQEIEPGDHELRFVGWGFDLHVSSTRKVRIEKKFYHPSEEESDGVVLTGVGGEIKILWTRPAKLDKESRLMFRMSQGAERISDARAVIELDGGEKAFVGFMPNQAVLLGNSKRAGKTIRRITILLKMKEAPFKLRLGELLLFHPRLIQLSAAIHASRPSFEFIPLVAVEAKAPERMLHTASDNRISGVFPAGNHPSAALSWTTPVHQPAGALVALQFDHRLSATTDKPCWAAVTLNGKSKSVTRKLCPEGTQGKHIEPLAQFAKDFSPDEIIRSISWKVQLSANQRQAISFDFQAHLGTVHAPSVASLMKNYAVFNIHQKAFHPAALTDAALKDLARLGTAWLDLGTFEWQGGRMPLQLAGNHSYFQVSRVNLESNSAPIEEQSARLSGEGRHNDSPWLRRLAMVGLILSATIWAWLRRASLRRLRERGFLWMRATWPRYRSVLVRIAGRASGVAFRLKIWANRAIGAFMLVPGLWLLGRMENAPLTRGLAGFVLMLAGGALWHELRWRYSSRKERAGSVAWWFGNPEKIPAFVLCLTAAATGWMAWNLGRGETYGALLILVAVGYFYFSWLALAVRWAKTDTGATWVWALLAAALYLLGLRYGTRSGENYFFTVGGLVAVLAGRAGLLSIRARFKARWPVAAERVYGGAGTLYFAGALVGLVLTALLMALKLEPLAEQAAIVVYYFLVAGVVLEILALRRESRGEASKGGETATRDAVR